MRPTILILSAFLVFLAIGSAEAGWDPVSKDSVYITAPSAGDTVMDIVPIIGTADNNLTVTSPITCCQSEFNPLVSDPNGDSFTGGMTTVTAGDVGNTWVDNDNGATFSLSQRTYQWRDSTLGGGETELYVEYLHVPSNVMYRVSAIKYTTTDGNNIACCTFSGSNANQQANPVYNHFFWVQDASGAWCDLGDLTGYGSGAPTAGGQIITWDIPYGAMAWNAPPANCGAAGSGTAVVGDDLADFHAYVRIERSQPDLDDETNAPSGNVWFLGGSAVTVPNPGPYLVNITVDGTYLGNTTTDPNGGWEFPIDFSLLVPNGDTYRVTAQHGNATDNLTLAAYIPNTGGFRATASGATRPAAADADLDGEADGADTCPVAGNGGDMDGDGVGDACDADMDGDGVGNAVDVCPFDQDPMQSDTDQNGVGDACEADMDGDGYSDGLDNCPAAMNPRQQDRDLDGVGDVCDPDDDGDSRSDLNDTFPLDPREWNDMDGDGIGDNSDPDADGDGFANVVEDRAGTDPFDAASFPGDARSKAAESAVQERVLERQVAQEAGIGGLGGLGVVLLLLIVGAVLFVVLRPRGPD